MATIDQQHEGERFDTATLFSEVLLIEDDAAHAKLIRRALQGVVGDVVHVLSAKDAQQALETQLFEIVFCDLHLPDMSGLGLLADISEALPRLPVVVMTSSHNLDDAVSAMRQGAWDYMVKQFSEDFAERVKLVVSRIAERKLQELRESKVRAERDAFWMAVHAAQDGVAILGAEGNVVFSNVAFNQFVSQLKKAPATGGLGRLVEHIQACDAEVAAAFQAQLNSTASSILWSAEMKVPFADGKNAASVRYFELSLSSGERASLDGGEVSQNKQSFHRRYVLWVRDITRRKEQEKFQRDLLATTSHDLKGPLGAILTSAELLADKKIHEQGKAQDLVTRIASCARNCVNLIDELLSARRIQDGVLVVNPRCYHLNEILEDIFLDYLPTATSKSIRFQAMPVAPDLEIYADKIALHRVLGNLISNAVKFTPKGGAVEISASRIGSEVRISVRDTGPGIDSKVRHLLFERYGRLEQHKEIEGTGLGLFVTKNILAAHGGRIEVQSELGAGTTFTVCFPDAVLVQKSES